LSRHFEESGAPEVLPRFLPEDWKGGFVVLVMIFVRSSFLDNISAVCLEDSPQLALGNVFGADMMNVFVIAVVALMFGVRNVFGNQGRDTQILVLLSIGLVVLAAVMGAAGDVKLGPTSLGALYLAFVLGQQ
jgi:Ca2+/Na+ antiporter